MVSDINKNKQDESGVLRAEDVVPPYSLEHRIEHNLPIAADQAHYIDTSSNENIDGLQVVSEIPKFNLADQIMAEQRKITSIRRKAPGKKTKEPDRQHQIESIGYVIKPVRSLSEKELIIAEIVARDIEKLYRGDRSSV